MKKVSLAFMAIALSLFVSEGGNASDEFQGCFQYSLENTNKCFKECAKKGRYYEFTPGAPVCKLPDEAACYCISLKQRLKLQK